MSTNLLSIETIDFDNSITTKQELFEKAAMLFEKAGIVSNSEQYKKDLFKREEQTSTGIEDGFGIPHAKSPSVTRPGLAFIKTAPISDYMALDDSYVEYAFVIAVPESSNDEHLVILSCLARNLVKNEFRNKLKEASQSEEVMNIMSLYKSTQIL